MILRCAVVSDTFSARMTKAHNNANMLAMGGRVVGPGLALDIVDAYLDTEFEGGRHQTRVSARMTKAHNNANMLAMGGRVVGPGLALDIVDAYLDTEFEGGRHQTRVDMLMDIEKKYTK